jgi:hypothetical protein
MVPVRVPDPVTVATVVSRLLQLQFRSIGVPSLSRGWQVAVAVPPTATVRASTFTRLLPMGVLTAKPFGESTGVSSESTFVGSSVQAIAAPASSAHQGSSRRRLEDRSGSTRKR